MRLEKEYLIAERIGRYIYYLEQLFLTENPEPGDIITTKKIVEEYKREISSRSYEDIRREFLLKSHSKVHDYILQNRELFGLEPMQVNTMLIGEKCDALLYKNVISLDEAAALYTYSNPKIINRTNINKSKELERFPLIKEFIDLLVILEQARSEGRLKAENTLLEYHNVFDEQAIIIYKVEDYLEKKGWIKAKEEKLQPYDEDISLPIKEADKPLHAKERESLEKLFIGMACSYYGADLIKSKEVKVSQIMNDILTLAGIELNDDTIRKHMRSSLKHIKID